MSYPLHSLQKLYLKMFYLHKLLRKFGFFFVFSTSIALFCHDMRRNYKISQFTFSPQKYWLRSNLKPIISSRLRSRACKFVYKTFIQSMIYMRIYMAALMPITQDTHTGVGKFLPANMLTIGVILWCYGIYLWCPYMHICLWIFYEELDIFIHPDRSDWASWD